MSRTTVTGGERPIAPPHIEYTPEQMSAYFLELEGLLSRVEHSTTHYQVLGVDRAATQEQINSAYQQMIKMLYAPYGVNSMLPPETTARTERAFNKASQSFSVLAGFARRRDYDNTLSAVTPSVITHAPTGARPSDSQKAQRAEADRTEADNDPKLAHVTSQRESYLGFSRSTSDDNRRRCERFKLALPVQVVGHERKNGKWNQMCETVDVSRTGLTLRLRRRVRHGAVLYLTLPLPVKLRSHGYADSSYKVYALVRRVEPPRQGVRVIGVEFLGEHPPAGFLERPWAVFRTKNWVGTERRRASRVERAEVVRLEYFSEEMQSIMREEARTENISRRGMRVAVKAAPAEFDLIRVCCTSRNFESYAAVRNRYLGKDGVERLCLHFVDREWPL